MKDVPVTEWAKRLLEDQILRLSELRNASPRDAGFKLWRQTTLTVIQRIWPGDLVRCERFRRIPFSTPSTKASRSSQKQHYERGCLEAGHFLRMLITEIEGRGLAAPPANAQVGPARLPSDLANRAAEEAIPEPEAPDPRDLYEPSPLEKIVPSFGKTDPAAAMEAPLDVAPELEPEPVPEPPPPPPPPLAPPRAAAPPAVAPPPKAPPAPPPAPPAPKSDRRALKEMLGFGDLTSASAPATPRLPAPTPRPPAPTAKPAFSPPPHPDDFAPPLPPLAFSPQDIEDFPVDPDPVEEEPVDPIEAETEAEAIEALEVAPPEPSADPSRDLAIEFLRRSPVMGGAPLSPQARARTPVAPPPAPSPQPRAAAPTLRVTAPAPTPRVTAPAPTAPPTPVAESPAASVTPMGPSGARSPAAAAFAALAGEIARLGVPEGQRAAARAALTDMAQRLSNGTLKWDSVCQVLTMAAAYPELARRAVPLLVPFLDAE